MSIMLISECNLPASKDKLPQLVLSPRHIHKIRKDDKQLPIFHTAHNVVAKDDDKITVIENYSKPVAPMPKRNDTEQNNSHANEITKCNDMANINSTNSSKLIVVDANFNDLDSISDDDNDDCDSAKFMINSDIIDKLSSYEKRVQGNGKRYYSIDLLKKLAINSNRLYKQPYEPTTR